MIKMMMAAAGLSLGLMMMPVATTTPAQAGVNIDININGKNRISCRRGERIVEDNGFFRVRARDCSGSSYRYTGRRNGKYYVIDVNSRRGYITSIRRDYNY